MKVKGKIIIGLTGVIFSGKSAALNIFKTLGAGVLSADNIVKELYGDPKICAKIKKLFGTVDKQKITEAVFKNPAMREKINALLHPLVMKKAEEEIKKLPQKIIVFEVPLLFEAHLEKNFDITLAVGVNKKTQSARAAKRGLTQADFKARAAAQLNNEEKIFLSDVVIENNGSLKNLETKIKEFYKNLW